MSGALHHCAGTLIEIDTGETMGLHSSAHKLRDEAGVDHVLFMAHGRGDDAARRASEHHQRMQIGRRYHASGTLYRQGETMHFYFGAVEIKPDQRRQHVQAPRVEVQA